MSIMNTQHCILHVSPTLNKQYILWHYFNGYLDQTGHTESARPLAIHGLLYAFCEKSSAQISNTAQTGCLSSYAMKTPGQEKASIEGLLFSREIQIRDRFSTFTHPPPPTRRCHTCLRSTTHSPIDWVFRVLSHSVYYSSSGGRPDWIHRQNSH